MKYKDEKLKRNKNKMEKKKTGRERQDDKEMKK